MAAPSSGGRLVMLCRQFQHFFRISPTIRTQQCAAYLIQTQRPVFRETPSFVAPPLLEPFSAAAQCRALHTTVSRRGLDEFFDFPENWGQPTVKSGAPWTAKQLRTKSNEDLHKLWYVLLKEKNMLLTLEQEAKRQRVQMPSPERLEKIDRSLIRLDIVVEERETALRLLQTGQERGRPGAWRKSIFGYTYWYSFREHAIPWFLNTRYKRKKFYTPCFVQPHMRLRLEKKLRERARNINLRKETLMKLKEKFPHMKVPAS
ncbi:large ribosomal subunit protein uL29m [Gouania willdenowi]|nr:39S ribosomal protein L47, mitochondrial [Gouania willdenowi]